MRRPCRACGDYGFRVPRYARPRNDGDGAAEGIRTPDPRITNAVLYRLSYRGIIGLFAHSDGNCHRIATRKPPISFSFRAYLGEGRFHDLGGPRVCIGEQVWSKSRFDLALASSGAPRPSSATTEEAIGFGYGPRARGLACLRTMGRRYTFTPLAHPKICSGNGNPQRGLHVAWTASYTRFQACGLWSRHFNHQSSHRPRFPLDHAGRVRTFWAT